MPVEKPEPSRCAWVDLKNPLSIRYHDEEWGTPSRDDRHLFEMLALEAAQAGLSWNTILNKRAAYRAAFDGFDPERVARYTPGRAAKLLQNPGIVRNRLKIAATIHNAGLFLAVQREHGSFADYVWAFVGGETLRKRRRSVEDVPATTPESDALSRDLRKRGFKFVGSTICYAYMQSIGMVDDHLTSCFRCGGR